MQHYLDAQCSWPTRTAHYSLNISVRGALSCKSTVMIYSISDSSALLNQTQFLYLIWCQYTCLNFYFVSQKKNCIKIKIRSLHFVRKGQKVVFLSTSLDLGLNSLLSLFPSQLSDLGLIAILVW